MKVFGFSVEDLPNNKTIERMTYYKDGKALGNMLADPYHMNRYLSRGFTLIPPRGEPQTEFICETCGKSLKTKLALSGHSRSHEKSKKEEKT